MCDIDEMNLNEHPIEEPIPSIDPVPDEPIPNPLPSPEPAQIPGPESVIDPAIDPIIDPTPDDPYNPGKMDEKESVLGSCDCRSECKYNTGETWKYSNYGYSD